MLAIVLVLTSGIALAQNVQNISPAGKNPELSGKDLLDKIISRKPEDKFYATGYVVGVYGVLFDQRVVPDERTSKKIVGIVKKYLKANKDDLDRPAMDLVISALTQRPDKGFKR